MALGALQNEADLQRWLQDQLDTMGLTGAFMNRMSATLLNVDEKQHTLEFAQGGVVGASGATSFGGSVGNGFSSSRSAVGTYAVTFSKAFAGIPAVLIDPTAGGATQAIPNTISATGFNCISFTTNTAANVDSNWNFLVVRFT